MGNNIQVPKNLDDKIALRQFLVQLSNMTQLGDVTKNYNTHPTTAIPMDTTKYDEAIKYLELDTMFKSSVGTSHTEYSYIGSKLDKIEVWEDQFKTVRMFTKSFTYTGDYISQVVLTDEIESLTLTKTITIVNGKKTKEEVL